MSAREPIGDALPTDDAERLTRLAAFLQAQAGQCRRYAATWPDGSPEHAGMLAQAADHDADAAALRRAVVVAMGVAA